MTSTSFNVGMSMDRSSSKATSSSSDSESDEDYVPSSKELKDEANEDDAASEDDDNSAADSDEASGSGSAGGVKRRKQKSTRKKKKTKLSEQPDQAEGSDKEEESPKKEPSKNIDDIWKAFKQDVESTQVKIQRKTEPVDRKSEQSESEKPQPPKTKTVSEIFEFAGEAVVVEKEVPIDAPEPEAKPQLLKSLPSTSAPGPRRGGGGLSSVLGQIGKKNKLSILEKTKLDWNSYKKEEGIDEQLKIHNKGKDGFLERQDFLQRTDLRQFEIEKAMRSSSRRNK
ncbi:craniofacial development protein 1 isoform X10 [Planococcus citri]|uniref:craniofacial development protein 1 isoform X10 n=1 Tax=Planococcus citri TaxID=170843 RepID=UPI0031F7C0FC